MCADPEVGLEHDDFWDKAYRVKRGADGQSCYPSFLRPLVAEILASGKALLLLRSQLGHRCSILPMIQKLLHGITLNAASAS